MEAMETNRKDGNGRIFNYRDSQRDFAKHNLPENQTKLSSANCSEISSENRATNSEKQEQSKDSGESQQIESANDESNLSEAQKFDRLFI